MKLIIESGATKTSWCTSRARFETAGMNFAHQSADALRAIIGPAALQIGPGVEEVHLYGAGIIGQPPVDLGEFFPGADIECASDLLAAARAVCGRSEGIAAILGTGSNSCLYDGEKIVANIHGGGYIIGDEGGAASLGRMFLADFIKDLVPEELAKAFIDAGFDPSYGGIVENVYRSGAPAKYFGSIAPVVTANLHIPYAARLVADNFRSFFERTIVRYGKGLPVGVIGGFAAAMEKQLREVAAEYGIDIKSISASPLEGLIRYHGI